MSELHLFEGFGVEIENMIVDRDSFDVKPICDLLLEVKAGEVVNEVESGRLAWSNELVLHVVELKTLGPAPSLSGLASEFQRQFEEANAILERWNARVLPTGMHPWMDPHRETRLWPHENDTIYRTYDRIFGCQGHGWSNLQSTHINLPFQGDDEFGRLHAAIRLVLPILPAIAAASPYTDGAYSGFLDHRLETYRHNQRKIPSIAGRVIPEPVFDRAGYDDLLRKIRSDIAPHDPEKVLESQWLNSRGAIARFDRGAIEIRVIDAQECPAQDLAVLELAVAVLRGLVSEELSSFERQSRQAVNGLAETFLRTVTTGDQATVDDPEYLHALGLDAGARTAGEVWRQLASRLAVKPVDPEVAAGVELILQHGPLARRLLDRWGESPSRAELGQLVRRLAELRPLTP